MRTKVGSQRRTLASLSLLMLLTAISTDAMAASGRWAADRITSYCLNPKRGQTNCWATALLYDSSQGRIYRCLATAGTDNNGHSTFSDTLLCDRLKFPLVASPTISAFSAFEGPFQLLLGPTSSMPFYDAWPGYWLLNTSTGMLSFCDTTMTVASAIRCSSKMKFVPGP